MIVPDQEVQETKIISFDVTYTSDSVNTITIKLSAPVSNPTFLINNLVYTGTASNGNTTYTITNVRGLKTTEKNTLIMKDSTGTEIGTKEFVCRVLNAPTGLTIPGDETNAANRVTTTNVSKAHIQVTFNPVNTEAVTLVVEITDTKNDKKAASTLTFTKEVTARAGSVSFDADLSSLNDGQLTVKAYVTDKDGNKSTEKTGVTFTKATEMPKATLVSATRTNGTDGTIELFTEGNVTKVAYLVKEAGEEAPSKEQVIAGKFSASEFLANKLTFNSTNSNAFEAGKAYDVYLVAYTVDNISADEVLKVSMPKNGLTQLTPVSEVSSTLEPGVYTWTYDEETEGLAGYRAVLKKGNVVVAVKDIPLDAENKVNFFDEMKKAASTYTFDLYAVGDDVVKTTSSAKSTTLDTVASVVTDITVKLDKTTKTKLIWQTTGTASDVKDFTLELAKYNSTLGDNKEYEIIETVNNITAYEYDVAELINKHGAGQYAFVITANPKDNVLKSSKKSTTADIDAANPSYSGPIYYQINDTVTLEVTNVNDDSVKLTGSLIKGDYKSNVITYKLYQSNDGSSYTEVGGVTIPSDTTFTVTVPSLDNTKTYYFKIKTTIASTDTTNTTPDANRTNISNTGFYDSEAVKVNLTKHISTTSSVEYKEYKNVTANGEIDTSSKFTSNMITYNENTLYINDGTLKSYTVAEIPEVADIINALKVLKETDELEIKNNKVLKVELKTENTYELGEAVKDAALTLSTKDMTVKGTVKSIELSDAHEYDLSGLTISGGTVKVGVKDILVKLPASVKLEFADSIENVTLNGVKLTASASKLSDMTYANCTLTLDAATTLSEVAGKNDAEHPLSLVIATLPSTLSVKPENGIAISCSKATSIADSATVAITVDGDGNTLDLSKVTFSGTSKTGKVTVTTTHKSQVHLILDSNSKVDKRMDILSSKLQFTDTMYISSHNNDAECMASTDSNNVLISTKTDSDVISIEGK